MWIGTDWPCQQHIIFEQLVSYAQSDKHFDVVVPEDCSLQFTSCSLFKGLAIRLVDSCGSLYSRGLLLSNSFIH